MSARRRRKTKSERDAGWHEAQRRAWEFFEPKLKALQSFEEALRLVYEAPAPDSPGRSYYSNLGFFLQAFTPPAGASLTEYGYYLEFARRLDAAGKLKKGALATIEGDFARAMKDKNPWQ
jgi:hypothetical protein